MKRAAVLLLAVLSPATCSSPRPGLVQGEAGDLPPDPGPPGWQTEAAAPPIISQVLASTADSNPAQAIAYEPPPALTRSSIQASSQVEDQDGAPRLAQAPEGPPDSAMPHGDFQAFGGEGVARALTEQSIGESNKMIDQIERAEIAETKRSAYRALTRLRGAATAAYDGVAKTQMGNIDEYAVSNRFRDIHAVTHLANTEGDVATWAFPNSRGPAPPVSFTAHASNTTKASFWANFFDTDGPAATGDESLVKALDSAIPASGAAREILAIAPAEKALGSDIPASQPRALPDKRGHFWTHFFEGEEGLPDHK